MGKIKNLPHTKRTLKRRRDGVRQRYWVGRRKKVRKQRVRSESKRKKTNPNPVGEWYDGFRIRKRGNDLIIYANEEGRRNLIEDPMAFIYSDALFFNDLYPYVSSIDGWSYLYDANRDLVYRLDDYRFNVFKELYKKGKVVVEGFPNDEDYEGYEWNTEN